jgi:hypothetical protein
MYLLYIHSEKKLAFSPSPARMSLTKLSLGGNYYIIPVRESLVSDIPAGDGKNYNLFYSVIIYRPSITKVPVYPDIIKQPETEYCIPK